MIILFGFRGCGKSVLGKEVAKRLSWDFIDTDHLIKHNTLSYKEIFRQDETLFRHLEKEVVRNLKKTQATVIAVGGGCMLDRENRNILHALGTLIYLRAPKALLEERMHRDPPPYSFIEHYAMRKSIYESIPAAVVDIEDHAVEKIMEIALGK